MKLSSSQATQRSLLPKIGFQQILSSLLKANWIAYAKRPFTGPEQVLEYLGRYTHRVAISNNRILSIDNGKVSFTYRDREKNNEIRIMTLDAHEFIRRFLLHTLTMGFMKIRYFGFLAHKNKKDAIVLLRNLIDPDAILPDKMKESIMEMMLRLTGNDITCCPKCGKGKMKIVKKSRNYQEHIVIQCRIYTPVNVYFLGTIKCHPGTTG